MRKNTDAGNFHLYFRTMATVWLPHPSLCHPNAPRWIPFHPQQSSVPLRSSSTWLYWNSFNWLHLVSFQNVTLSSSCHPVAHTSCLVNTVSPCIMKKRMAQIWPIATSCVPMITNTSTSFASLSFPLQSQRTPIQDQWHFICSLYHPFPKSKTKS